MSFYKTDQILSFGRNLLLEERRRCVIRGCENLGKLRKIEAPRRCYANVILRKVNEVRIWCSLKKDALHSDTP